ncbi:MAG: glycosyltransferase [Paludibacter sp.]|nr:glycosyltransferase [Paludibacter sp.]
MLNASIVLYNHKPSDISVLVRNLRNSAVVSKIFLIDNSPEKNLEFEKFPAVYIFNNQNIGYGAAHNIAIKKTMEDANIEFHLVINPDIGLESEILQKIENFMKENLQIGLLMPKIFSPDGKVQYLCKLIPTPSDLLLRRFLPKSWTKKRTAKFEMRSSGYNRIMHAPYLSGCFMFLRISALREIGLFDERFFMYPEDIDLTRRMYRKFRTVFYPEVSVTHSHTRGSYGYGKLFFIHILNIIKYFNKWGWIFDRERDKINRQIITQINTINRKS